MRPAIQRATNHALHVVADMTRNMRDQNNFKEASHVNPAASAAVAQHHNVSGDGELPCRVVHEREVRALGAPVQNKEIEHMCH